MDDLYDLQASVFVTDTEDQDSLDERIDSEQRIRNQQLWASFQNAACCITKLYKDRTQPNVSPWVPFQNAASNLTTLYKDCIESQRNFARIGYQIGRRRRYRELAKLLKKYKIPATAARQYYGDHIEADLHANDATMLAQTAPNTNVVSSILAVNQLNLGCDDVPTQSMQVQQITNEQSRTQDQLQHSSHNPIQTNQQQQVQQQNINLQTPQTAHPERQQQQQQGNTQSILVGNEEDLLTFQQALAQSASKSVKTGSTRKPCSNSCGYLNSQQQRAVEAKSEEDRLIELNQFLSEEYHRHVGSRKRPCSSIGGSHIKRFRE